MSYCASCYPCEGYCLSYFAVQGVAEQAFESVGVCSGCRYDGRVFCRGTLIDGFSFAYRG
jgi:hypothetical protein